jgi:hypothetical protein
MNSLLANVSARQLLKAAALKEKIERLQNELTQLLGAPQLEFRRNLDGRRTASSPRRRMSLEAKAKIAAAAKARWKKAKAAGKNRL